MANRTSFKKGQVANPKGRAKGAYSKHKQQFIEIQKLAGDDAERVYGLLKQAMEAGEAWAHQIYWKTLYPRSCSEDSVKVNLPKSIGKDEIEEFITEFVLALRGFDDFNKDEVTKVIKALSSVKTVENSTLLLDSVPQIMVGLLSETKN